MPPKKRPRLSTYSARQAAKKEATRKRLARQTEDDNQRQHRLQVSATRNARVRSEEDGNQRQHRLQVSATRNARVRFEEDGNQRQHRLQVMATRYAKARSEEDDDQRQHRLEVNAAQMARARSEEDDDQRQHRLQVNAAQMARARSEEDDDQRQHRLQVNAAQMARARSEEDDDQRQHRLQVKAAQMARARSEEDDDQRQHRLQVNAAQMARARSEEDDDQRQHRLQVNTAQMVRARSEEDDVHRQQRLQQDVARRTQALASSHRKAVHSLQEYSTIAGAPQLPNALNIGAMEASCCKCHAKMWSQEIHTGSMSNNTAKFSTCCSQGKVILPSSPEPPHLLKNLLSERSAEGTHFRTNIRAYNSSLAFTSLGVNEQFLKGRGPPTFRIQGTVCHRTGQLLPEEGEQPKFSQIFIYDVQNQLTNRMKWNDGLQRQCLHQLQQMLHDVNPYIKEYKHAAEVIRQAGDNAGEVRLVLKETGRDPRRYNLPTTSDIAIIMPGSGEEPGHRDIALYRRASDDPSGHILKKINECHRMYDPLHYVLLFPHGETGWQIGIQLPGSKNKMSPMLFYSYKLMVRDEFSILLHGGRLFQQYVVDMYAKVESGRLTFHRFNQDTLHAELYQGLCDAVNNGDTDGNNIGRLVVLPASFTGSPRSMFQHYQDAMAIVRRFGKPDLFITMTCNPNWPEIKEALLPQQTASDRPDIVVRVFMIKMKNLIDQLTRKHILGKVIAFVYVIEFQKRGLPHAHILTILSPDDKPKSSDDYDKYITAEIPDKNHFPDLYTTISCHMLHGPCGHLNSASPCMKDGVCSKGYPKPFAEMSQSNEDGYPVYRRRDNGCTVDKTITRSGNEKELIPMDNRWVVPYNPYLTALLNTHINVEICNTVRAVKYLYKYIYKGNDMITAEITQHQSSQQQSDQSAVEQTTVIDEISNYVNARFITPQEACWRIFHYPLHNRSPAIQRLSVHLEGQHQVIFREGHAAEALSNAKDTTLMAWFKTNQHSPEARKLLYTNFPEKYTWDQQRRLWKPRKAGTAVGRMSTASPSQGERYYLRMLLTHVRGATSFVSLRTLPDGTVCPTYKDAALQLGLLESDTEWHSCLHEATQYKMPTQLRHLFAIILVFAEPAEPGKLWNDHKSALCEDIQYQRYGKTQTNPTNDVINTALHDIERYLQIHGKHLSDYDGLPQLQNEQVGSSLIHQFTTFSTSDEAEKASTNIEMMNAEQRAVYNEIIAAATNPDTAQHTAFFIDGPGGTGKTFTYNTMAAALRSQSKIVIPVATSGIAAEMLDVARTAHSAFKIPIPIQKNSTCNIKRNSSLAKLIQEASLIIFDEAPMAHKQVIECLERSLRDLTQSDKPFGGKVIAFGGDFRQVLPVVRHGSRATVVQASFKRSTLWKHVKVLHLKSNMRAATSGDLFPNFLLRIGDGIEQIYPDCDEENVVILPPNISLQSKNGCLQDLIDKVFPNMSTNHLNSKFLCGRGILTTKNDTVDDINSMIMETFPGEQFTYSSADCVDEDSEAALYPTEFLNTLTPSGLPPHELSLKINAPIMLLRNLDPARGLLNGTRLIVRGMKQHVLECEICTGRHYGSKVLIPRITLSPSDTGFPFLLKRRQFPVRLAFSMTINKSQGQTLDYVGLYLPEPVFTHGQLYVALSRARCFENITILTSKLTNNIDGHIQCLTKNIVYKEILH